MAFVQVHHDPDVFERCACRFQNIPRTTTNCYIVKGRRTRRLVIDTRSAVGRGLPYLDAALTELDVDRNADAFFLHAPASRPCGASRPLGAARREAVRKPRGLSESVRASRGFIL